MKFSTREDVDVPIEDTFTMLTDFEQFEAQAIQRGADIARTDSLTAPGVGMTWEAQFDMRGRRRGLSLRMDRFDRPNGMLMSFVSNGLEGDFDVTCKALSPTRTRISLAVEFKPQTLSARLLVQSLKLAKTSLNKRFKLRVAQYAQTMEQRYQTRTT